MKHLVVTNVLLFVSMFVVTAQVASIGRITIDEVTYVAYEDGTNVVGGTEDKYKGPENVVIPETVTIEEKEYTLNLINNCAFLGNNNLRTVVIPNTIVRIGIKAFMYCRKLESISIPESVISIERQAFARNKALKSVELHENLTSIGHAVFEWCESLQCIVIPNTVTTIESSAFYSCSSLESVYIPDSVSSIGKDAFGNCTALKTVVFSSVEQMEKYREFFPSDAELKVE